MYTSHEIVQRIYKRLEEIGMSKTEFSQKSSVSFASLSQWNTGQRFPSLRNLNRVAECLNMSVEELTNGSQSTASNVQIVKEPEKAPQDVLAGLRDDQKVVVEEVIEYIRGFDGKQCHEFYNMLESVMKLSGNK